MTGGGAFTAGGGAGGAALTGAGGALTGGGALIGGGTGGRTGGWAGGAALTGAGGTLAGAGGGADCDGCGARSAGGEGGRGGETGCSGSIRFRRNSWDAFMGSSGAQACRPTRDAVVQYRSPTGPRQSRSHRANSVQQRLPGRQCAARRLGGVIARHCCHALSCAMMPVRLGSAIHRAAAEHHCGRPQQTSTRVRRAPAS